MAQSCNQGGPLSAKTTACLNSQVFLSSKNGGGRVSSRVRCELRRSEREPGSETDGFGAFHWRNDTNRCEVDTRRRLVFKLLNARSDVSNAVTHMSDTCRSRLWGHADYRRCRIELSEAHYIGWMYERRQK